MGDTDVTDVSPLAGSKSLVSINMNISPGITDLSSLTGLTNLEDFSATLSDITDISGLADATKLRTLELCCNQIADISALANLTELTSLTINDNRIVDVSPLAKLTNLESAHLSENLIGGQGVGHVDELVTLRNVRRLEVHHNPSMSCSELQTLTDALGAPPVYAGGVEPGVTCSEP